MNSALAALVGLVFSIILIIRKVAPVYSLILGAVLSGILSGWGLELTVEHMVSGVKDITPAILRILTAGVLSGVLIRTGAGASIARTIVDKLGRKQIYMALAISAFVLTAIGVFIDVAVITIAPVALMVGSRLKVGREKLLLALIAGGKCGNIISPNPNTLIAAENFSSPLPSVMAAGILPALIGLVFTALVLMPMAPKGKILESSEGEMEGSEDKLPSFLRSIAGPVVTILLLALRPLFGIVIDPLLALPIGGLVGLLVMGKKGCTMDSLRLGLEKMAPIAVLLVGTGTIAGVIKASAMKDVLVDTLGGFQGGGSLMAVLSGALMSAATASTTAGATIASASFSDAILLSGVAGVWAAAMVNAGATILDHLPHGSFFHTTGGSMGLTVRDRLRLIPYECLIGAVLALSAMLCASLFQ